MKLPKSREENDPSAITEELIEDNTLINLLSGLDKLKMK